MKPEKQHEAAKRKRQRLAEEERRMAREKQKAEEEKRVAAAHLEQMRKNDEERMRRVRVKRRRRGEPVNPVCRMNGKTGGGSQAWVSPVLLFLLFFVVTLMVASVALDLNGLFAAFLGGLFGAYFGWLIDDSSRRKTTSDWASGVNSPPKEEVTTVNSPQKATTQAVMYVGGVAAMQRVKHNHELRDLNEKIEDLPDAGGDDMADVDFDFGGFM